MGNLTPAVYFDIGAWEADNLVDWSNPAIPVFNPKALDIYIDTFIADLKAQGVSTVLLCYAQVSDLWLETSGDYMELSEDNSFGQLLFTVQGAGVNGQSVVKYISARFQSNNILVGISFGGPVIDDGNWSFPFSEGDPDLLVKLFLEWADTLNLYQYDFNIETLGFSNNDPSKLVALFSGLHKGMKGNPVTLTVPADTTTWGLSGSVFKEMFAKGKFEDMFDGLNLMLYDDKKYYLNASQTPIKNWDLSLWLDQLQKNTGFKLDLSSLYLGLGFSAGIDYSNPENSAGPLPYKDMPSSLSSGAAAAYIYNQLEQSLSISEKATITFGQPFFWDPKANYSVDTKGTNQYKSNYFNDEGNFQKDFFAYLKGQ